MPSNSFYPSGFKNASILTVDAISDGHNPSLGSENNMKKGN